MSGREEPRSRQGTRNRQESSRGMEKRGKAHSVDGDGGNGGTGVGQGKQGLRFLLESLAGEEFIVTVEFGKGAGDAGEA